MELQEYLRIAKRYWRSILATIFACIVLTAGFTLLQKPTYTSTSSVFLSVESGGTAGELSQGASYAERQVTSYVAVASTEMVLEPVAQEPASDLSAQQLARKISVSSPSGTSIIRIAATDGDPATAAVLSNAVAESLIDAVDELAPDGPEGTQLVSATVIDHGRVPATPTSPRPAQNLALGGLLGLLLGFGQALLRSVLDTRVRNTDDIEALSDKPILASVGHAEPGAKRPAETSGSRWANAEAYRKLRTNVGFVGLGGERRNSMVITSAITNEGKTETIVNLARVLAHAGESVLLIDADMREPTVATRMNLDSELGLSDVLTGRGELHDLTIEVAKGFLSVLPAGTVPPNPSELLGSDAMSYLISTVERQYDYVLFDCPPLLPVTDATVLAAQTGGAIVVARSGVVKRQQLESALEIMETGGVTILGLVLNDVPVEARDAYRTYYVSRTAAPTPSPKAAKARQSV